MAPLLPPASTTATPSNAQHPQSRSPHGRQHEQARACSSKKHTTTRRSASFHGGAITAERQQIIRRPKTQPDLLAGRRGWCSPEANRGGHGGSHGQATTTKVPTKLLVNVTVQRSLWPVQVMASTEWSTANLVAAVLQLYVKEGRRPALPSMEPSAYTLHYSQFSLESLDPEEKLIRLGSRNFFLCPKAKLPVPIDSAAAAASSSSAATSPSSSCSNVVAKDSNKRGIAWLRFMEELLS